MAGEPITLTRWCRMTGKQIKKLREALGETQQAFADRLGLQTRGAVSAMERGHPGHEPSGPTLKLLELLFDLHVRKIDPCK